MKKNKFYYFVYTPICIFPLRGERKGRKEGKELKTVLFLLFLLFGLFSNNAFSQKYYTTLNLDTVPAPGTYIAAESINLLPGFHFKATDSSNFEAMIESITHQCIQSIDITNIKDTTYYVNSNITWVNFIPTNDTCSIVFGVPPELNILIDSVKMYSGTCNSLTLINTYAVNDSLKELYFTNLNVDSNYYFKVEFNNVIYNKFWAGTIYKNTNVIPCYPQPCNLIIDGNFECYDWLKDSNITHDYAPFIPISNSVPYWHNGWGTPNITTTIANMGYSALLWGKWKDQGQGVIHGEGIYQIIDTNRFVPGVEYELTFDYYKPYNPSNLSSI